MAPHTIRVNHSVSLASWPLHYWELTLKGEGLEGGDGFYPLPLPSTLPDLQWGLRICWFEENRVSKVLRQGVLAFRVRKVWCSEDRRTKWAWRAVGCRNRKHLALSALPTMLRLLQNSWALPPGKHSLSFPYLILGNVFVPFFSFPIEGKYRYVTQSTDDSQDFYPVLLFSSYKNKQMTHVPCWLSLEPPLCSKQHLPLWWILFFSHPSSCLEILFQSTHGPWQKERNLKPSSLRWSHRSSEKWRDWSKSPSKNQSRESNSDLSPENSGSSVFPRLPPWNGVFWKGILVLGPWTTVSTSDFNLEDTVTWGWLVLPSLL